MRKKPCSREMKSAAGREKVDVMGLCLHTARSRSLCRAERIRNEGGRGRRPVHRKLLGSCWGRRGAEETIGEEWRGKRVRLRGVESGGDGEGSRGGQSWLPNFRLGRWFWQMVANGGSVMGNDRVV